MFSGELAFAYRSSGLRPEFTCAVDPTRFAATAESEISLLAGELRLDNPGDLFSGARGLSPSQIVLNEYERVGDAVFDRIEGEFALAIYNKRTGGLTLARDALGRRPLHHAALDGRVVFSSEATPVARRRMLLAPDLIEVASFLLQRGQGGQRSFFSGVSRVRPGTTTKYKPDGSCHTVVWWKPDLSPTQLDDGELLESLEETLTASVAAIMSRHERVAAHLSAGLDSSLAVATASRILPPLNRLRAYCISPAHTIVSDSQAIGDEYPLALQTAAMLKNVDLTQVRAADDDWLSHYDRFTQNAGMPYRNMSALGWFSASYAAAAEGGATGLIESTDGNATLSWLGNGAVPTMIRQGYLAELCKYIRDIRREKGGSGALTIPWGLWALLPGTIADPLAALCGIPRAETKAFLKPEHPAVATAAQRIHSAGHWNRAVRPIRNAADRLTLLWWSDRAPHFSAVERMFGIELCDPYSAKRLVELSLRIEEHRFLDKGFGRRFARALLRGKVPESVAAGRIDWLQATDWRVGAIAARAALLDDLDYARREPELADFYDIAAMDREVRNWTAGAETAEQMSKGFAVLRAIGTIRFARWLTTLRT